MTDAIQATQNEYVRAIMEYAKAADRLKAARVQLSSGTKETRKAFEAALSAVADRHYAMSRAETEHLLALQVLAENQLSEKSVVA